MFQKPIVWIELPQKSGKPAMGPSFVDSSAEVSAMRKRSCPAVLSDDVAVEVVNQSEAETTMTDRTSSLGRRSTRQAVVQALMRTPGVVVFDVSFDEIAELALSKHDEPIQTLTAQSTHEPLSVGVQVGRGDAGRMFCHTPLSNAPGLQFFDEEHEPMLAEHAVDGKEVAGEQRVPVSLKELFPRAPGQKRTVAAEAMKNTLDGSPAEIDGDFGEFALDLGEPEPRVEPLDVEDQLLDGLSDGFASWRLVRELPAEFEEVAVPAESRLGLNDQKGVGE